MSNAESNIAVQGMKLFSRPLCADSHRVRLVLAEKGINVDIHEIEGDELPQSLVDVNPYNSVPTLSDRDMVLYHPRIIMEYIDERFPHPPLMPVDPVSRASRRLALHRIEEDWYRLIPDLEGKPDRKQSKAKKELREGLTAAADIFALKPYFLSDEMSLVDCTLAPLLWRLPRWGIELPKEAKAVTDYATRIFNTETFQASLTEEEMEIRV